MPSYDHLLRQDIKFSAIEQLVRAAHMLGAPYEEELENSEAMARRQAEEIAADIVMQGGPAGKQEKQAIALIAYIQRMGTDIFRTETPAGTEESPGEAPPAGTETETPLATALK
jgi:cytochrome c oxidase cbb3-type subunit I/II